MSSAEDPAELWDLDLLLRLLPVDRLLPDLSPPDFAEDLSDPESDDDPDPLEPLDDDDEDPLEEDPDPELDVEPSSPDPSSSDEVPPPDAEEAERDCLPVPVAGLFGGILFLIFHQYNINSEVCPHILLSMSDILPAMFDIILF